jgi:hypothetical protein
MHNCPKSAQPRSDTYERHWMRRLRADQPGEMGFTLETAQCEGEYHGEKGT